MLFYDFPDASEKFKERTIILEKANDKMVNNIELNRFLSYNIDNVINYYSNFKEEENAIKKNSKRYLAK